MKVGLFMSKKGKLSYKVKLKAVKQYFGSL